MAKEILRKRTDTGNVQVNVDSKEVQSSFQLHRVIASMKPHKLMFSVSGTQPVLRCGCEHED